MAGLPGSMASLLPAGPDEMVRRQRDLERRMDEALPSVARSFAPVIADLAAKQVTLDAQQATLTTQQATLATTVSGLTMAQATLATTVTGLSTAQATLTTAVANIAAQQTYLASLISKDTTLTGFNTGTLINDGAIHYAGATAALTIDVPTGKLRVITSCPEASMNPGTGAGGVQAYLSFSLAGPTPVAMGTYTSRAFTTGSWIGSTLSRITTLTLTPGTYTVTMQTGYFCNGFAAASINFGSLSLSAEVVNGS